VAGLISFRLGGTDGVSIEAGKWQWALGQLGYEVRTIAGEGPVDHLVNGLAITPSEPVDPHQLERALEGLDLVVVENLCSLPLNPGAARLVAERCAGRPTILHHHDLAWQRPDLGTDGPPDDPSWRHVTINELSRRQLAARGIDATTIYNRFDTSCAPGDRGATRRALGISGDERLFLQPTRALARKNVPAALSLCERLGATYWLLGPAEDGYGPELDRLVERATCPIRRGPAMPGAGAADAYAACDLVMFPSTWEGFGNPTIESAVHRRPLCVGPYPVAAELRSFGFLWFTLDDAEALDRWMSEPDPELLEHNYELADTFFSLRQLPERLEAVLATLPIANRDPAAPTPRSSA